MNVFKKISLPIVVMLFLTFSALQSWAAIAANTQIINSAKLSYNDGSQTREATASVTVTVNLVQSAPTIIAGPAQSASYAGVDTVLYDSYTITASANGPDTYNLTAAVSDSDNTTAPSAAPTVVSIVLGGSVTTTGSTDQIIVVPSDGTSDGSVNGIEAGDTVVINGETRTVAAIQDNPSGTSTITLNAPLSEAPGAGVPVAEQKVVQVEVKSGTIETTGADVTASATLTTTSDSDLSVAVTSSAVLNTYTSGVATITTYVRNVSTPSGTGTAYIYNAQNYYLSGVTAKPGETLEYILVATNTGAVDVTASIITDVLNTAFVAFKSGVYSGGSDITYVNAADAASYLTAAVDTDAGNYVVPAVTVNVGTGATNSDGGIIAAEETVKILYQVTVNN
jgi:hypothetical protein